MRATRDGRAGQGAAASFFLISHIRRSADGCDRWWQIYNIDSGVEQWIDYPRVIKMLEDVGFDGIISLVFELNTVFGQKEAAGVDHLTEEECVPLAVSHLRDCIAGTAPSRQEW